jgi:hypothetical protein
MHNQPEDEISCLPLLIKLDLLVHWKFKKYFTVQRFDPVAQARIFSEPPSTDQFISIIQIATDISINFSNLVEILDLENKIEDYE